MPFLRDDQGRMIRKDGSLVPRPVNRRGPGKDRASCLKIDAILGAHSPMRDEYEKLMDTPGVYLRDLQTFLADREHKVCMVTVKRHRAKYRDRFAAVREAAKMAEAFCRITNTHGTGAIVEASQGRFEMLLMQDLFDMKENPKLQPGEWQSWAKAVSQAVDSRRDVERMRQEYERKAKEAVAAVEKNATGKDVVVRMREILGV